MTRLQALVLRDFVEELGDDLEEVADHAEVGGFEEGCFKVVTG